MTETTRYWLWLSLALGVNTPKQKRIFDNYESIIDFYLDSDYERRLAGFLSEKDIDSLNKITLADADELIKKCSKLNIDLVCFDDENYPKPLLDIYAPPCILYVWGKLPDFENRLSIAMIGTRNATQYGVMTSHVLSSSLAKLGVIIVSGGALGIDTASHIGALEADGTTVCVLGCGIDYRYLMSNALLRKNIASTGAVISEYPPGTAAFKGNFPVRNRLISGLSHGVVVVEADEKSGSLITANHALEQGREVFAVMGNINSLYSSGTNKMIKDGAIPVTSYEDIIEAFPRFEIKTEKELNQEYDKRNSMEDNKAPSKHREDVQLSDTVAKVYECIGNEPIHADKIALLSGLHISKVLQALTELELLALVSCQRGRLYKLV